MTAPRHPPGMPDPQGSAAAPVPARAAALRGGMAPPQDPKTLKSQLDAAVLVGQLAVWRHDLRSHCLHWNDIAARALGMTCGPQGAPLQSLLKWVHPDDRGSLRSSARLALGRTGPVEAELRLRDDGGPRPRWRRLSYSLVVERGAQGEAVAFHGLAREISPAHPEDRRSRDMLRRLEWLCQSAGMGFWSVQHERGPADWSSTMLSLHGLAPGAPAPGWRRWLREHVHPEDRNSVRQSFAAWLRSARPAHDIVFRLLHADGSVRHVAAYSRRGPEPGLDRPFGLLVDVSEQQAALAAVQRSDERSQLLARSVGVGIWEHDLVTDDSTWDEQMWRLRGREPQPRAPDTQARRAMVHPADQQKMDELLRRSLQHPGPLEYEFRVCWPDGSWRWLAARSTTEVNAQGQAVRRIGLNWDVTEARKARVAEQEKLAAQRELQAKLHFLSRMSHELRTPLNAMLGFAQLLEADEGRIPADTRLLRLGQIRLAGQQLLALIDDVLDLSRLEGGEMSIATESVPLPALVASVLPLVEQQAVQQGVQLRVGTLEGHALADPKRLRQVLLNLLTNAIKYNRPAGHVLIEACNDDNVCVLRVSDTGRGISAEQRHQLFEPFNRLGAERDGVQGTGIGLAIVKALVERMGGTVQVESTPGAGSTFELRLRDGQVAPMLREGVASPQVLALAAISRARPRPGRVLYIEDNPVNALIVNELVERHGGLELRSADTGREGVNLALDWLPDLVLLDMQLPDLSGEQVFAELRAQPSTAAIPCIALSANAMPADIARARLAGFTDYWTKPLDFRVFHEAMLALFGTPRAQP